MNAKLTRETVQSVQRCLDVLETVASIGRPVGVSELSRSSGLSKATVHRLCKTLLDRQFLRQDAQSGQYSPGWRLLEVTCQLAAQIDLKRVSHPILEQMAAEMGQNAFAGALIDGVDILIFDEVRVNNPVQPRSLLGLRLPVPQAPGGVLCQATPLDKPESALQQESSKPLQDMSAGIGENCYARKAYAIQMDVPHPGITVICSPLVDRSKQVAGVLGFCHPILSRMPADPDILGNRCEQAAQRLSSMLVSLNCKGYGTLSD